MSGWAIVANDFAGSQATTDVLLGTRTSGIIVGKDQGLPIVEDQTGNNDVLQSSSSSRARNWGNARGAGDEGAREQFEQQLHSVMSMLKRR